MSAALDVLTDLVVFAGRATIVGLVAVIVVCAVGGYIAEAFITGRDDR